MNKPQVYCLIDPRNNHIRYVGGTIRTLSTRLKSHISLAKRQPHNKLHVSNWIRSLLREDCEPQIKHLWWCDGETYYDEEIFWIAFFRICACDLTNATNGGEGILGYKYTDEHRKKTSIALKGKPKSEQARKNMSLCRIGKPRSEEAKKNMSLSHMGKRNTPEQIERHRQAMLGKKKAPHTEEVKKVLSIATKKYWQENREKILLGRQLKKSVKL